MSVSSSPGIPQRRRRQRKQQPPAKTSPAAPTAPVAPAAVASAAEAAAEAAAIMAAVAEADHSHVPDVKRGWLRSLTAATVTAVVAAAEVGTHFALAINGHRR